MPPGVCNGLGNAIYGAALSLSTPPGNGLRRLGTRTEAATGGPGRIACRPGMGMGKAEGGWVFVDDLIYLCPVL